MLFYLYKSQSKIGFAESLYWHCYISIYLVSLIALIQFVGAIEAILLAWVLVDLLGGALFIISALEFITGTLSAKLQKKPGQKI